MTVEPLVVEFGVRASPAHAFDIWTRACGLWWPSSHTISGDPAAITFEPRVGGRIYERAPDGQEHEWGEVIAWDPPDRVSYIWHLFFERSAATEVELTFIPASDGTAVRLEQRGWDSIGVSGPVRRARTGAAWAVIAPLFGRFCES